jgi:hypothetical protein
MQKKSKSTVNAAGNYTKPTMRKNLVAKVKAGGKGGKPGQWSAREYAATSAAKRKGTKAGKQFVSQPKKIAKKTAKYRK